MSLSASCLAPGAALALTGPSVYGSGIAAQVAKPKGGANANAGGASTLLPAEAPKLQSRLKTLSESFGGKKQQTSHEMAAEEVGFGFGFDVQACMDGSGSWIGAGAAPAASTAPHASRAVRRRREEDE